MYVPTVIIILFILFSDLGRGLLGIALALGMLLFAGMALAVGVLSAVALVTSF